MNDIEKEENYKKWKEYFGPLADAWEEQERADAERAKRADVEKKEEIQGREQSEGKEQEEIEKKRAEEELTKAYEARSEEEEKGTKEEKPKKISQEEPKTETQEVQREEKNKWLEILENLEDELKNIDKGKTPEFTPQLKEYLRRKGLSEAEIKIMTIQEAWEIYREERLIDSSFKMIETKLKKKVEEKPKNPLEILKGVCLLIGREDMRLNLEKYRKWAEQQGLSKYQREIEGYIREVAEIKKRPQENENKKGESLEKTTLYLLNKKLGKDFIVLRTSEYDDRCNKVGYELGNGLIMATADLIILDLETGSIFAIDAYSPTKVSAVSKPEGRYAAKKRKIKPFSLKIGLKMETREQATVINGKRGILKEKFLIPGEVERVPLSIFTVPDDDVREFIKKYNTSLTESSKIEELIFWDLGIKILSDIQKLPTDIKIKFDRLTNEILEKLSSENLSPEDKRRIEKYIKEENKDLPVEIRNELSEKLKSR